MPTRGSSRRDESPISSFFLDPSGTFQRAINDSSIIRKSRLVQQRHVWIRCAFDHPDWAIVLRFFPSDQSSSIAARLFSHPCAPSKPEIDVCDRGRWASWPARARSFVPTDDHSGRLTITRLPARLLQTRFVTGLPDLGERHGAVEPVEDAQRQGDPLHDGPSQETVKVELHRVSDDLLGLEGVDHPHGHVADE